MMPRGLSDRKQANAFGTSLIDRLLGHIRDVVSNGGLASPIYEHQKHAIILFAANQQGQEEQLCCRLPLLRFRH